MCHFVANDTRNLGEYSFTMRLRLWGDIPRIIIGFFASIPPPKKPKILKEQEDEVSHWGQQSVIF